VEETLIDVAWL